MLKSSAACGPHWRRARECSNMDQTYATNRDAAECVQKWPELCVTCDPCIIYTTLYGMRALRKCCKHCMICRQVNILHCDHSSWIRMRVQQRCACHQSGRISARTQVWQAPTIKRILTYCTQKHTTESQIRREVPDEDGSFNLAPLITVKT